MRQACDLSHRVERRVGGQLRAGCSDCWRVAQPLPGTSFNPTCLKAHADRQEQDSPGPIQRQATRRQILGAAVSGSVTSQLLLNARLALADEAGDLPSSSVPTALLSNPQKIEDFDFYFIAPLGFKFIETQAPAPERGPAPEQSPIRARLDSPDGFATVSVIVRGSQTIKSTFFQVNDISTYGSLEEAGQLLLPRGSVLLSSSAETVMRPAKETPLGTVEPSNTYYRYEFTTNNGLHIFLSAAAQRGRVYICGATTSKSAWDAHKEELIPAVLSFRLKASALGPRG